LGGCGYKAPPSYKQDAPAADKNVKFIIKDTKKMPEDNNESCE
jgi:hypothetical protein